MIVNGKSLYDNNIMIVAFTHRKYYMAFKFNSKVEAKGYYNSFNHEKEKLTVERFNIYFCKHDNMEYLDVGSKIHHFNYCPDCNMALFVDDESKEDKASRRAKLGLAIKESEIEDLVNEIEQLGDILETKKAELTELEREGGE